MRRAILLSNPSTDDGTFGVLMLDDNTIFRTGELPWRNNSKGASCIPPDPHSNNSITYVCKWIVSPKHGECYLVTGVSDRDMIEIHSANYMGDANKGKITQLLGCIALGKTVGMLDGQMAVLQSKQAIAEFEANMAKEDFELTIIRKE